MLGGGVSGAAVIVTLNVAVLPPPPVGGAFFGKPLHEMREMADIESNAARTFRKFMSPHGERVPSPQWQRHQRPKYNFTPGDSDEQMQNESRLLNC